MLLAESDPVYTAIYQFIVIAMLYAASGLTALVEASGYERAAFEEERLVARRDVCALAALGVGKNSARRPIISGTRWFPIDVRAFRGTLLIEAMEPSTILNGSSGD